MFRSIFGYRVTMRFRVMERKTDVMLMAPFLETYIIQPPVYTSGDIATIEMHLELQTKLKCLYELRSKLACKDASVKMLISQDFTVRGEIVSYVEPSIES